MDFSPKEERLFVEKSEKMIADKLYYKQIPYKYEVPLKLNNYGIAKGHPNEKDLEAAVNFMTELQS